MSNLTRKMISTVRILNANYNNAETVTRAQIQALVDAGDFKWPYWITDYKHGYCVKRGEFRLPVITNETETAAVAAVEPEPEPVPLLRVFRITDPKGAVWASPEVETPAEAMNLFVAARKRAKKSFSFANVDSFEAVSA
jgi:hypothetical protein